MEAPATGHDLDPSSWMLDATIWILLVALGGGLLYEASLPVASWMLLPLGGLAFAALVAFIVVLPVVVVGLGDRRRWLVRWVLPVVGGGVVVWAGLAGVPDRARFALSRSDLNRAADQALRGEPVHPHDFGHYAPTTVTVVGDGVEFAVPGRFLTAGWMLARDVDEGGLDCMRLDARWQLCEPHPNPASD